MYAPPRKPLPVFIKEQIPYCKYYKSKYLEDMVWTKTSYPCPLDKLIKELKQIIQEEKDAFKNIRKQTNTR